MLSAAVPPVVPPSRPTASRPPRSRPARTPAPEPPAPRRRGLLVPLLAGLAVLLVLGLVLWAVLGGGRRLGGPATTRRPRRSPDRSPTPGGGALPVLVPAAPAGPTAAGMEDFIQDYLATVTSDPDTAFAMLTPGFQQASGGLSGYRGFWDTIRSARRAVVLEHEPRRPHGRLRGGVHPRGRQQGPDDVRLQLVYQDGEYLIDGEA